jgi:Fe-S cluster assembly iron-binding protein IscA
LGLALDEPQKDDEVFEEGGVTYVIDKQLFERVKPIQVEFVETALGSGYRISANLKSAGDSRC